MERLSNNSLSINDRSLSNLSISNLGTNKRNTALFRFAIRVGLTASFSLASCSSNGSNLEQIRQQAGRKLDSGDYQGALVDLSRFIRLAPKDGLAYYNRGVVHSRLGLVAEAIVDYGEAIKYRPGDSDIYINRAMLRRTTADLQGALSDYKKAIEVDPSKASGKGYNGMALVYLSQGNFQEAKRMADLAIKADPKDPGFFTTRGVVQFSLADFGSAIADYSRAISLQPSLANNYANRANAQIQLANYRAALQDIDAFIKLMPDDPRGFTTRALIHSSLGEETASGVDLEKAANLAALQGNDQEYRRLMAIRSRGNIGDLGLKPNTVIWAFP